MVKTNFNPSAISLGRQCEICYKLRYIDGLKGPEKLDLEFGTALHLGLHTMISKEGDGVLDFQNYWKHQKHLDHTKTRFTWSELKDKGLRLLDLFERLHLKRFNPYFQEKTLMVKHDFLSIYGTPDFVGEYNGAPSIVDFKTTARPYHKEAAIASEQMLIYAWLVHQTTEYKIEQIVYYPFVKNVEPSIQKPVIAKITQDQIEGCLYNFEKQCIRLYEAEKQNNYIVNYSHAIQGEYKNPCFDYLVGL